MNLNSHNIDADGDNNPTGRSANNGSSSNTGGRDMNSNASNPERWILVLAIAILVLGAILLTLRSAIFSLILIIVGIVLFTYWMYGVVRTRERGRHSIRRRYNFFTSKKRSKDGLHMLNLQTLRIQNVYWNKMCMLCFDEK